MELEEVEHDCGVGAVELTGMPSGSSKTSVNERITFKRISVIEKINKLEEVRIEIMNEITDVINAVEDDTEQTLLSLRYLKFKTWEEIATELHYSWRHTHRIHKQALNDVIECHTKLML